MLCVVAAVPAVAAASASAESSIEGVWSFNGGAVAIQPQAGGTFTGTVLETTTFDECPHQVGELMWTHIAPQADGSYWGFHQWFFGESGCEPNKKLGRTAWRVLPAGTGKVLRVCLSAPGSRSQPTIEPDGASAGATFGCVDSALVSALPVATTTDFLDTGSSACIPADKLRIPIRNPKADPLAKVTVILRGGGIRRVARVKPRPKSFIAVVKLGRITAPTVRATVRLTTVLGAHLKHRRVYRRCG